MRAALAVTVAALVMAPAGEAACTKLMRPTASGLRSMAIVSSDQVEAQNPSRFVGALGSCVKVALSTNARGYGWKRVVCSMRTRFGYRFTVTWSLKPNCDPARRIVRTR